MSDMASDARRDEMRMRQWEIKDEKEKEECRLFIEALVAYIASPRKRGARQMVIDCAQSTAVQGHNRWGRYANSVESGLQKMRQREIKEITHLLIDFLETTGVVGIWYKTVSSIAPIKVTEVIHSVDQTMLTSNIESETIHRLKKLL
ncbi:MAG: hypothetical protein Q7K40_02895 [bacterium]|nr:hypothetical protein [bacterium]